MHFIDDIVSCLAYVWLFLFALPQLLRMALQANTLQRVHTRGTASSFDIIEGIAFFSRICPLSYIGGLEITSSETLSIFVTPRSPSTAFADLLDNHINQPPADDISAAYRQFLSDLQSPHNMA
ncbi:hypothetical protein PMIN03_002314 [Paraphaeosphaeria minitans]